MTQIALELIKRGFIHFKRKITRMTSTGNERYLIYLPEDLNEVWRAVHEKGLKVGIYIEIPSEPTERQ